MKKIILFFFFLSFLILGFYYWNFSKIEEKILETKYFRSLEIGEGEKYFFKPDLDLDLNTYSNFNHILLVGEDFKKYKYQIPFAVIEEKDKIKKEEILFQIPFYQNDDGDYILEMGKTKYKNYYFGKVKFKTQKKGYSKKVWVWGSKNLKNWEKLNDFSYVYNSPEGIKNEIKYEFANYPFLKIKFENGGFKDIKFYIEEKREEKKEAPKVSEKFRIQKISKNQFIFKQDFKRYFNDLIIQFKVNEQNEYQGKWNLYVYSKTNEKIKILSGDLKINSLNNQLKIPIKRNKEKYLFEILTNNQDWNPVILKVKGVKNLEKVYFDLSQFPKIKKVWVYYPYLENQKKMVDFGNLSEYKEVDLGPVKERQVFLFEKIISFVKKNFSLLFSFLVLVFLVSFFGFKLMKEYKNRTQKPEIKI